MHDIQVKLGTYSKRNKEERKSIKEIYCFFCLETKNFRELEKNTMLSMKKQYIIHLNKGI